MTKTRNFFIYLTMSPSLLKNIPKSITRDGDVDAAEKTSILDEIDRQMADLQQVEIHYNQLTFPVFLVFYLF